MTDLFKLESKSTPLLGRNTFKEQLTHLLKNAQSNIVICSGFITRTGVKWIEGIISEKVNCKILTSWNSKSLLNGGSDIESLSVSLDNGWEFRHHSDYHGKIVQIDKKFVAVSSANLTKKGYGLGIIPCDREETGIIKEIAIDDINYINGLLEKSYKLSNEDYIKFKKWYEDNKGINDDVISYPKMPVVLKPKKKINTNGLWVENFPMLSFEEFSHYDKDDNFLKHDLDLFEINNFNERIIKNNFKNTHIYNWLLSSLEKNKKPMNFGAVTELIHNNILDDTRQYRMNIKKLQSNLYSYIKKFNYDNIQITQPNRSEILTLIT
jgi:hypothetical protein